MTIAKSSMPAAQTVEADHSVSDFHSAFGGLWVDRRDWRELLHLRRLPNEMSANIEHFVEQGYVILEGACAVEKVDAFKFQVEQAFQEGRPGVLYQNPGDTVARELDGVKLGVGARVLDSYVPLPAALDLFASDRLVALLTAIFDETPLLHQSLSFYFGSQQGLHQDTAYVVVDRPLELAACWIALEDVEEGSGELYYVPGSHREPEFVFAEAGGRKHFDPTADGRRRHDEWSELLRHQGNSLGTKSFLAKKGDILVWHADLAHGGAPIAKPGASRQSLVGHFCPLSARPHYFYHGSLRDTVLSHRGLAYSSDRYELRPPEKAP